MNAQADTIERPDSKALAPIEVLRAQQRFPKAGPKHETVLARSIAIGCTQ